MRGQFWKEYGPKLFALFIILMMITVVYPVLICLLYTSDAADE